VAREVEQLLLPLDVLHARERAHLGVAQAPSANAALISGSSCSRFAMRTCSRAVTGRIPHRQDTKCAQLRQPHSAQPPRAVELGYEIQPAAGRGMDVGGQLGDLVTLCRGLRYAERSAESLWGGREDLETSA